MRIGVDTGGTFTDVVGDDGSIAKVPSTPSRPDEAVRAGASAVSAGGAVDVLCHGTTVATNALLEGRLAVVALVTNEGLGDVIEIGRQDRPSLYDERADRPPPLVPRHLRFEVVGRLGADGAEVVPLDAATIAAIPDGVAAVAVCLLHADLDPVHELAVLEALRARAPALDVTCSHQVSPEFREYERLVTTVLDAALRPVCRDYLTSLTPLADEVLVMTSAGGLRDLASAAERPASLLLSGPAGGVGAGAAAAVATGFPDAVTFDMGGTSTDVCLVLDGAPAPAAQRSVAGYPVRLPSLDVHTIGAGGGSVTALDSGGALVVGPRSAGAVPGPACYGRGGVDATVTDADLVAGRIVAGTAFAGLGALDLGAATAALDAAGVTAEGVLAVVDAAMVQAVRSVTLARGVDPRKVALVAFGGAGPLHACAVAEALDMPAVVVPPQAGVLSAVGLLRAPRQVDLVRSWPEPADHAGVAVAQDELAVRAARRLLRTGNDVAGCVERPGAGESAEVRLADGRGVAVELGLDCRYAGQSHELTVASTGRFEDEHERRNGYRRPGTAVEIVALRATARVDQAVATPAAPTATARRAATGPAVLSEPDCTVWVAEGWRAEIHRSGSWVLRRT